MRTKLFFTLATGRCGTRSLSVALDAMEGWRVRHESVRPRLIKYNHLAYADPDFDRDLGAVRRGRTPVVRTTRTDGDFYGETAHYLSFLAPALREAFPKAGFIHLVRHIAPYVRSCCNRAHYGYGGRWPVEPWKTHVNIAPRSDDMHFSIWEDLRPSEKSAWYWCNLNEFALDFVEGDATAATFRLEDIAEGGLAPVLEHLGAPGEARLPRTNKSLRYPVPPVTEDGWAEEFIGRLQPRAARLLERLGYRA